MLKMQEENLSEMFYSVNTVFESAIQSKGIQYSIDTNIQHKYAVCDKTKLQEIYLNIVSNAISSGISTVNFVPFPCSLST